MLQGSGSWLMKEKLPKALPSFRSTPGRMTLVEPTITWRRMCTGALFTALYSSGTMGFVMVWPE